MSNLFHSDFNQLGELFMLNNKYGVPCGVWKKPGSYTCTIAVSFFDGVLYEEKDEWGFSHFLEHVHFKRTKNFKNFFSIASFIEEVGGKVSAFSTRNSITYWVQVPRWEVHKAFYVLKEILTYNNFLDEDVEKEKILIKEEILREKNNPRFYNKLFLEEILLSPSPLARHPLGSVDSISNLDAKSLINFKESGYGRKNMYISITGDTDMDILNDELNKFLQSFENGQKKNIVDSGECDVNDKKTGKVHILNYQGAKHTNMAIGWNHPLLDEKEQVTWQVLNSLLGIGFSSLLFQKLREECSLTYLVQTSLRSYPNNNTWRMDMDLMEENIPKALHEIDRILLFLGEGKLSENYLNMTKKMYFNKILMELDDGLKSAKWMAHSINTFGKLRNFNDLAMKIYDVTVNDIVKLVQRCILSSPKTVCFAGPPDKIMNYYKESTISIVDNY